MHWNRQYIIKSYIRASLWFVPFLSLLAFWVISRITYGIGGWLLQTLPPHRHAELRQQLDLLDGEIDGHYTFAEDRVLAQIPDPQGLGGSVGMKATIETPTSARAIPVKKPLLEKIGT